MNLEARTKRKLMNEFSFRSYQRAIRIGRINTKYEEYR